MSDYGPECSGGIVGAAGNSFFNIAIPFIGSLCTSSQVKQGDRFRKDTQALLEKHFNDFHPGTKVEIKNHLRRYCRSFRYLTTADFAIVFQSGKDEEASR